MSGTETVISTIDVMLWVVGLITVIRIAWRYVVAPLIDWSLEQLDKTPLTVTGRSARRLERENG